MSLSRTFACDLEVRADGTGRTVYGICCPFDSPADIHEDGFPVRESFTRGAFAKTISERGPRRVKFLAQHNLNMLPIGRAIELREDSHGLFGAFRVSQTQAGDEVLALVADGALDSFSIGFQPVRSRWSRDMKSVTRVAVKLFEVSCVSFPAFAEAKIDGIRGASLTTTITNAEAKRRLTAFSLDRNRS